MIYSFQGPSSRKTPAFMHLMVHAFSGDGIRTAFTRVLSILVKPSAARCENPVRRNGLHRQTYLTVPSVQHTNPNKQMFESPEDA
jgi:hypothetical protein